MKKTWAQYLADRWFAAACRAAARACPLPAADFLTCIDDAGEWHAAGRGQVAGQMAWQGRDAAVRALCGRFALHARRWPEYGPGLPSFACRCAECAWIVAFRRGTVTAQLDTLMPPAGDRRVLDRFLPDPLIAFSTAKAILGQAGSGGLDDEPGSESLIQLLAAVTRHRPVITLPEECAHGECAHVPDDPGGPAECPMPDASVACSACSLVAGSWAGEYEGAYRRECTVPAPCPVLSSLAGHAGVTLVPGFRDSGPDRTAECQ